MFLLLLFSSASARSDFRPRQIPQRSAVPRDGSVVHSNAIRINNQCKNILVQRLIDIVRT